MSDTQPAGDPQPQWQQPPFIPGETPPQAAQPPAVTGPIYLPVGAVPPPPSATESALRVISGVVWPMLLGLALFGIGGWVGNVILAIILSSVLGRVTRELRRRRKSGYELPSQREDLR